MRRRRSFLVKRFAFRAVDESLEDYWSISDPQEGARRNRKIIADKVQLGETGFFCEVRFIGVSNRYVATFYRKYFDFVIGVHIKQANTIRGDESK
jgi:hypothetical protein